MLKGQLLLLLVGFGLPFFSNSQTQGIAYTAAGKGVATTFLTDYHCLGINSSALGWGTGYAGKRFTTGTSEFGFGLYSDALNSQKLRNLSNTVGKQIFGKAGNQVDWEAQRKAAADYAQSGISIFADYSWFGFAFQGKKFGGIAFNIRENYQWYSKLNEQTSDLLFRGKVSNYFDSLTVVFNGDTSRISNHPNISRDTLAAAIAATANIPLRISQITQGTNIKMLWTRSYNFGYGRKIIGKDSVFAIYAGVGGRFIQSMAMFDFDSNENGLAVSSSISPSFNINYGSVAGMNTSSVSNNNKKLPTSVGNGYGFDLSASIIILNKLKIAAAVNNIGGITYNRNVYTVKDTLLTSLSVGGLNTDNITQTVNQMLRENGLLQLQGKEKIVVKNPADFRFGASLQASKMLHFGFDVVMPFDRESPGSLKNPVYAFGGDFRPVKWLQLSVGYFGGGIYKNNIPVGINFILRDGAYEIGISSRDALSFFTKNSNSISAAFGFARVRF